MLSSYLSQAILNRNFSGTAFTPASTIYVALFSSGSEITGTGYVRQEATAASFAAATVARPSVVNLTSELNFGGVSSDWVTSIDEVRIFDAATGGNLLYSTSASITLIAGNRCYIANTGTSLSLGTGTWVFETTYLAGLMDWLFNGGAWPLPAGMHLGLENGGTEISGTGYARVDVNPSAITWSTATDADPSVVTNSDRITISSGAGSAWGSFDGVGIYDAASGGNRIYGTTLATTYTVGLNDSIAFTPSTLNWSLT